MFRKKKGGKDFSKSNWKLIITGWGDMKEEVKEIAATSCNIEFLGVVERSKLNDLYELSDVLIKQEHDHQSDISKRDKMIEKL